MPKKIKNEENETEEIVEEPATAEKKSKTKKDSKKISQAEYEKKVIELAKEGLTAEKIGEKLRISGIHTREYSKKISQILKEKGMYEDPELKNVEAKHNKIKTHYEKNKQDKRAKREKDRFFSKLRKVKKYLKLPLK
jgi:ribosomal protein S15P/S13E